MQFELSGENLKNPKRRFAIGILICIISILAIFAPKLYSGATRETCVTVEAVFDKCKINSSSDQNKYYLKFEDITDTYNIHPSCEDKELMNDLFNLKSGAKMKLLVYEKTGNIYELEVNGEKWLDFEYAKKKIDNNIKYVSYVGYACCAVGVICVVSSLFALIFRRKKEE